MMQKRSLVSLMLISFMVVFSASLAVANDITIESKDALRCNQGVVNVTANADVDVSAIEVILVINSGTGCGFFDALDVQWDPGFTALADRFVDLSKVDGVSPDTIRFAALRLDASDPLPAGSHVIAQLSYTTNDCCGDDITIDAGTWEVPAPPGPPILVQTQFVSAADASLLPAAVNAGTVSIVNSVPSIATIPDGSIPWGDIFFASAAATDADEGNGCELLSYSKVSGPATLNVDAATGAVTWQTLGADVCTHMVEVQVTDKCGATDVTSFEICVTNEAPTLTCPDVPQIVAGDQVVVQAVGADADGGPSPLLYSKVSTDFPGGLTVNPATGEITITTAVDPAQTGTFSATVAVTDGANVCDPCSPSNSAECTFEFTVVSNAVAIDCIDGQIRGKIAEVGISLNGSDWNTTPIAGYDLLISYDASVLSFMGAEAGQFLADCGWEYFTFRTGPFGNCGNGCPSGMLRLVAMAEINDGTQSATCFSTEGGASPELAVISFLVSSDNTLECQLVPIRFTWLDCGDNSLSSVTGDTLLISHNVYANTGGSFVLLDPATEMPSYAGAPSPQCDVSDKGYPWRAIDFYNGCIRIICNDEIDARGDINVNGIAYEIADAVMYTNYFLQGLSAFGDHVDASVAASDANADGLELSVADLVYLIRVVVGDAQPFPKVDANEVFSFENGVVSSEATLGGVYFEFAGTVTPELVNLDAEMGYSHVDGNTRVLVTIPMDQSSTGFSGEIISVNATDRDLIAAEWVAFDGSPLNMTNVPTTFSLDQNYPNPFNPTTTIRFGLPSAGEWNLTVYNIMGQVVETFEGNSDAGFVNVDWNAGNVSSGVYFYRLTSGNFTATKKAVLLK